MNYFTCDSCHYIFQSDDVSTVCPICITSSVIAQNSSGRKFKIPAIRFSTEVEIEQSQLADTEECSKRSYLERIESLPGYTLTDDEYHVALMLLFYFKSAPKEFISVHLGTLLSRENISSESGMDETAARDLYTQAQRHFISELGKERRKIGCNDAITVATYTEKGSAASLLLRFRQNGFDQILGKTPNLTNIRSVMFDLVVKEPGEGYLRFLMDWYNSLRD